MNNYAEDIQDDGSTLFLTVMNHNKKNLYLNYKGASILQDVYLWLKKGLDINYPDRPISNYSYMASMENVDEICDMIAAFGTGITVTNWWKYRWKMCWHIYLMKLKRRC